MWRTDMERRSDDAADSNGTVQRCDELVLNTHDNHVDTFDDCVDNDQQQV